MEILYETEGQFSSITGAPASILGKGQLSSIIRRIGTRDTLMIKAAEYIYAATEEWFDSAGEGTWPKLSEVTVARKIQSANPQPSTPLVAEGNLRASVTSGTGPYSFILPIEDGIIFGVNWSVRGYQIADVLSRGTQRRALPRFGRGGAAQTARLAALTPGGIPARPIWPPPHSASGMWVMHRIGQLFLKGV